jgi:hypothetical protein
VSVVTWRTILVEIDFPFWDFPTLDLSSLAEVFQFVQCASSIHEARSGQGIQADARLCGLAVAADSVVPRFRNSGANQLLVAELGLTESGGSNGPNGRIGSLGDVA